MNNYISTKSLSGRMTPRKYVIVSLFIIGLILIGISITKGDPRNSPMGKILHNVEVLDSSDFNKYASTSFSTTWKLKFQLSNPQSNNHLILSSPIRSFKYEFYTNLFGYPFHTLNMIDPTNNVSPVHSIKLPPFSSTSLYIKISSKDNYLSHSEFVLKPILLGRDSDLNISLFSRNLLNLILSFIFIIFSIILLTMILVNKEFRLYQTILFLFSLFSALSIFLATEIAYTSKYSLRLIEFFKISSIFSLSLSFFLFFFRDPLFNETKIGKIGLPILLAIDTLFIALIFTIHYPHLFTYTIIFLVMTIIFGTYYLSLILKQVIEKRRINPLQVSFVSVFCFALFDFINYLNLLQLPYTLPTVLTLFYLYQLVSFIRRLGKINTLAQSHFTKIKHRFEIKEALQKEIEIASREIHLTQKNVISRISGIIESRSQEPSEQLDKLVQCCKTIATAKGLTPEEIEIFLAAVPLHDIGTIGIPDALLLKGGALSYEEKILMSKHPILGYDILKHSKQDIFKLAAIIALEHHERWDGTGYPNRKLGGEINLFSRITAIADVYSTMTTSMPYRESMNEIEAFEFLIKEKGTRFDPELVDLFCSKALRKTSF